MGDCWNKVRSDRPANETSLRGAVGSRTQPSGSVIMTGTISVGMMVVELGLVNGLAPTIAPVYVFPSRLDVTV